MKNKIIILVTCALVGIGYFIYQYIKQYNTIGLTEKAAAEGNVIAQQNLVIANERGEGSPQSK